MAFFIVHNNDGFHRGKVKKVWQLLTRNKLVSFDKINAKHTKSGQQFDEKFPRSKKKEVKV